jgi:spermidine/putrescine transport system ATP-binding protein
LSVTEETSEHESATAAAPADVRLDRVTKRFDDVVAVDDLSVEIPQGSFFALLGPSGCGKTTTLRMLGGFEEPDAGTIYLAGPSAGCRPTSATSTPSSRATRSSRT